jgi:DNA-binding NarL/FixJ family response regulator
MTDLYRWQPPPVTEVRQVIVTARQADVLNGICAGYSNRRTGHVLGITEDTVKSHVRDLLNALGARDRCHAAVLATSGAVDITVKPRVNRRAA